MYMYKRKL
uniref:Uncharacterized protein n=1 Tax=Arundo donax TaxID=35708 RepID=A0A0A9A2Q2_ARUDO